MITSECYKWGVSGRFVNNLVLVPVKNQICNTVYIYILGLVVPHAKNFLCLKIACANGST